MAPCADTTLLPPLPLLVLHWGPAAEWLPFVAGAALWGSVTSQTHRDHGGVEAAWEQFSGRSRGANGAESGQLPCWGGEHIPSGRAHLGLSPQLCPVFQAQSRGQQRAQ